MITDINIYNVDRSTTVSQWLSQWQLTKDFTADIFLNLKWNKFEEAEVTNRQRIRANYTKEELESTNDSANTIIKSGTQVALPNFAIKRDQRTTPPIFDLSDFKPFVSQKLKQLLDDPKYYSEIRDNDGTLSGRTDNNDISVYAWIRGVEYPGSTNQEGTWYNISAFVESLQTNVSKSSGSFAMSLSPAICRFDDQAGWHLENVVGYNYGSVRDDSLSTTVISKYKNKSDNFVSRETTFFNTVMQENDLIYIRFERLAMEDESKLASAVFGEQDIQGKVYDMIGLVDSVDQSTSSQSMTTTVQGRDLMKLWIEDGSYFYPEQFAQNIFTDENSVLAKRIKIEKEANLLIGASYSFKPISIILKYIFNKFSNIGMVPNSVFRGYGDKLYKKKYELKSSSLGIQFTQPIEQINQQFLKEDRQGCWQICNLVFDPSAGERVLADNTIATDNGSIINSIRKICQEPFIEYYGDTYGDQYNFIVRKPPIDKKGYTGMVYDDVVSEQVLNLGIGQNDRIRRDQIDKKITTRANNGRPTSLSNLVIDIDEAEVMQDNLTYHKEAYSWYRVVPKGLGINYNTTGSFKFAPVVALDEYAKMFGNKMYTIECNYSPNEFLDDSFKTVSENYAQDQAFFDLKFIIEGHAYLPFTRQGSIKIIGNRTIKRGMFIYYKPTDEVFHVDSVTNLRTLNERSTTLMVSRGMKEKYIKGVDVRFPSGVQRVSYFNIVKPYVFYKNPDRTDSQLESGFNLDIFNFFIQRRQWADE